MISFAKLTYTFSTGGCAVMKKMSNAGEVGRKFNTADDAANNNIWGCYEECKKLSGCAGFDYAHAQIAPDLPVNSCVLRNGEMDSLASNDNSKQYRITCLAKLGNFQPTKLSF